MIRLSEDSLTLNKYIFILIISVLTGGGAFTGYIAKVSTPVTKVEVQQILNEELSPLNYRLSQIDTRTQVISVMQGEFARRLEDLEKNK